MSNAPGHRRLALADLGPLRKSLAEQAEAQRVQRAAEAARREALAREANRFADAMTGVARLPADGRRPPDPVSLVPVARQRALDEQAALAQSLSDDIDVATLLETDDRLSYRRPGATGAPASDRRRSPSCAAATGSPRPRSTCTACVATRPAKRWSPSSPAAFATACAACG